MKDDPDGTVATLPGTRLLAFARLWFDEHTLSSVFEPLVADWQREWRDAPRASRLRVRVLGTMAFCLTTTSLLPRIALAPLPGSLAGRVTRHVLLYCALSVALQGVLTYLTWRSTAPPLSAWLYLIPALFTALLPFAMAAGVDAIRCHEAWPAHVQRRAALKLVVVTTLWMVVGGGWIVPATNRQWQTAEDSANAGQAVSPLTRVNGLSTSELLTARDRASRSTTLLLPGQRYRELDRRMSFAALPILFVFVRWRLLDLGTTGWSGPLPMSVVVAIAIVGATLARTLYGSLGAVASPGQHTGVWIMMLFFGAVTLLGHRSHVRANRRSRDQQHLVS